MSGTVAIRSGRKRDGAEIIIDEADLPAVSRLCWSISTKRGSLTRYAKTQIEGKQIYLHRFIMNPPAGMDVDHIDGNGLNNARSNLRIVTRSENLKAAYALPGRYEQPRKEVVLNTIKRVLADGTVKIYVYDRVSGKRVL